MLTTQAFSSRGASLRLLLQKKRLKGGATHGCAAIVCDIVTAGRPGLPFRFVLGLPRYLLEKAHMVLTFIEHCFLDLSYTKLQVKALDLVNIYKNYC